MITCTRCRQFGHEANTCATAFTARRGEDQGGMRSLERIRGRCRVDDITGCWNWSGATASRAKGAAKVPVTWSAAHGAVVTVLRLAYGFEHPGVTLGARIVWRTCGSELCVNPAHLRAGTRKQWGEWSKASGTRKQGQQSTAARRAVRIAAGATKLTMELAQWVRESTQTGVDVAHAIGCKPTQISRARMLRTWAPTAPAASVFAWAANEARRRSA